jgi:hypothetical protein
MTRSVCEREINYYVWKNVHEKNKMKTKSMERSGV